MLREAALSVTHSTRQCSALLSSQTNRSTSTQPVELRFYECAKPFQSTIPLARDDVEQPARLGQPSGLELPHIFPAVARAHYEAGAGQHVKVLGDGLP